MDKELFDIVLLFALPASGKSEVRRFLDHLPKDTLNREFHFGETVQLDDFPYVYVRNCIDQALDEMGLPRLYTDKNTNLSLDDCYVGMLFQLLNEDYHDLINKTVYHPESAAKLMFTRFDNASEKVGMGVKLGLLPQDVYEALAVRLEDQCRKMLEEKNRSYPDTLEGKTIVIEAARGGMDGSSMPLEDPFGYQYSIRQLCPEILSKAVILYIWVTPEESRRKNRERFDPNDPGSSIAHMTPEEVMLHDYGCDDMEYLRKTSEVEDTVTIRAYGKTYHLPIGVFDNRVDKTTFLRADASQWDASQVEEVTAAVKNATDTMFRNYNR